MKVQSKAMVPVGYGDGTLGNVLDTSNNTAVHNRFALKYHSRILVAL